MVAGRYPEVEPYDQGMTEATVAATDRFARRR